MKDTNREGLINTFHFMQNAPWSFPYVVFCIVFLYFLNKKVKFFNNIKLSNADETSKSNNLATFIFFVIFMAMVFGFIPIIFQSF